MPFSLLLICILLVSSWFILYLFEKRNIISNWLTPPSRRFKEFAAGFLLMAFLCLLSQLFFSVLNSISWAVAEEITISKFLFATLEDVNSVLIEELLFRGVLLYLMIRYMSERTGILISAASFGIYHWFSYGVMGNLTGMVLVFLTTGLMGYVFAKAYVKTDSIVLPVGLHLGWNWINNSIFSNGMNGTILLVPDQTAAMEGTTALISFGWYMLIPLIVLFVMRSDLFTKLTTITSEIPNQPLRVPK